MSLRNFVKNVILVAAELFSRLEKSIAPSQGSIKLKKTFKIKSFEEISV